MADQIDNALDNQASGIKERMVNGGHYVPEANDVQSGVHAVSTNNYTLGSTTAEFSVYNSSRDAKVLKVTDTGLTFNQNTTVNGNLAYSGSVQFPGARMYYGQVQWSYDPASPPAESDLTMEVTRLYWPHGYSGTISRVVFRVVPISSTLGIKLQVRVNAINWATGTSYQVALFTVSNTQTSYTTTSLTNTALDTSGWIIETIVTVSQVYNTTSTRDFAVDVVVS